VQAATIAARASAAKSPVPALEGLLIEATERGRVRITGYDLKTGIVSETDARVPESGSVILNARLFGDIIRRLPGEEVTVSVSASYNTKIESGVSSFDIVGSPPADYPALPAAEGQTTLRIEGRILRDMIARTVFAVSDNESRPVYTGALFETEGKTITAVAVDGFRLALRREELLREAEAVSFIVPGSALGEIERILSAGDGDVEIIVGDKHVIFKLDNTLLISRRLEGEFLNYRTSIPQNSKYELKVSRRELEQAVERVSLIISDKVKSPVRCVFDDGTLSLLTISAYGQAHDECAMDGDGEKLEIGFNNRYLLDALKAAPADELKICLTTPVTPCVILPADGAEENFIYMILPVRLSSNEVRNEN
jgi:DNA polymerase-3 subunit beta